MAISPLQKSRSDDRSGHLYVVRLSVQSRRKRAAHIFRDGELIAEALYVKNWIIDAIACVLAVVGFFLPFVVMVVFWGGLARVRSTTSEPASPGGRAGMGLGYCNDRLGGFRLSVVTCRTCLDPITRADSSQSYEWRRGCPDRNRRAKIESALESEGVGHDFRARCGAI